MWQLVVKAPINLALTASRENTFCQEIWTRLLKAAMPCMFRTKRNNRLFLTLEARKRLYQADQWQWTTHLVSRRFWRTIVTGRLQTKLCTEWGLNHLLWTQTFEQVAPMVSQEQTSATVVTSLKLTHWVAQVLTTLSKATSLRVEMLEIWLHRLTDQPASRYSNSSRSYILVKLHSRWPTNLHSWIILMEQQPLSLRQGEPMTCLLQDGWWQIANYRNRWIRSKHRVSTIRQLCLLLFTIPSQQYNR